MGSNGYACYEPLKFPLNLDNILSYKPRYELMLEFPTIYLVLLPRSDYTLNLGFVFIL